MALAALVIDLTQLLYQGELASLPTQQAYPGEVCTARALWRYSGGTLQNHHPSHAMLWEAHLQLVLQHGPLARRIVLALDGDLYRSGMHAVYAQLSEGLKQGKLFIA